MELPITKEELDLIIELLKYENHKLYNKLWSYRINYLQLDKQNDLK